MNKNITDVLVLNKAWCPVAIVNWKKAMSLIYQDSAKSLDQDFISYDFQKWIEFSNLPSSSSYPFVHTSTLKIGIPEIVVLTKYDKLPIRDVKYSRETLFSTYKYRCAYCGNFFEKKDLTVDHIIPRSKGGKTTFNNTVPSCKKCNFLKADKTLEQSGLKIKYKLKTPKWIGPFHHVRHGRIRNSWTKFMSRVLTEE